MDVVRSHRSGQETSPDRAKICRLKQKVKPVSVRKVQIVYYLSRNGLLEHPHFMEITLSANQPLRLKDVFDRLMALRGSGMPMQYSWSSKRNYKSGYVWCDLALNDIILPSEGGEYVLKGSELVEGCSERFQQVNVSNKQTNHQQGEQNYSTNGYNNSNRKSKSFMISGRGQENNKEGEDQEYEEYEEQLEKEYELDGEKTSYTSSTTTPHSRCSRGVSTEELDDELQDAQNNKTKIVVTTNHRSPQISHATPTPSPLPSNTMTLAEKLSEKERVKLNSNYPKRFGNGDAGGESSSVMTSAPPSRYSVLLQLIACGSSGSEFKAKQQQQEAERSRLSNVGATTTTITTKKRESVDQKKHHHHHQGGGGDGDEMENMMMINGVSENPRMFGGNLQSCEEKEYFSGSIVESMKANRGVAIEEDDQPVLLKRSNSYNEERRSRLGMMEEVKRKEVLEQDKIRETRGGGVKEKCIPLMKSSKDRH